MSTERAKSFEHGASEYERLRPPFPESLFDDVVSAAGRCIRGRVLEVGAGTGRATLPLAWRGVHVHVVEPSGDMLRVLSDRLDTADLRDLVSIQQAGFEDLVPADDTVFDVVVAAQSFHWADPRTRWTRLAQLLADDGVAFMFWNGWQLDPRHHDLDPVRRVYELRGRGLTPDIEDHRAASDSLSRLSRPTSGTGRCRSPTTSACWRQRSPEGTDQAPDHRSHSLGLAHRSSASPAMTC